MTNTNEKKLDLKQSIDFIRILIYAAIVGLGAGAIGTLFTVTVNSVIELRAQYLWLIYFLPLGGVVIVLLYQLAKYKDAGTDLVINSIHSEPHLPVRVGPLIFISSVITHLFGGSAGREGAALQIGGSVGSFVSKTLHLKEEDKKTLIMAGMSGCFSALFGTPLTAAIFPLEVVHVGYMQYAALLPCAIASLIGHSVATALNLVEPMHHIGTVPNLDAITAIAVIVLSLLAGLVSRLFVYSLHKTHHIFAMIENAYVRAIIGAGMIIVLTLLVGNQDYNGVGAHMIERALEGDVPIYAFLLKILFTSVTLSSGYKGGEIIPSLIIGATLGSAFGTIFGLPAGLWAEVGMVAVFCGVTNCPITSLLIGFELFNFQASSFLLIAVAISYIVSGYSGLYKAQMIIFSKTSRTRIERNTN